MFSGERAQILTLHAVCVSADPCPAERPGGRAAIAVGVTLLVLVALVLLVYLLGRGRRTDGYRPL